MGLRGEAAASPGGGTVDISVSAAPWQHGEQAAAAAVAAAPVTASFGLCASLKSEKNELCPGTSPVSGRELTHRVVRLLSQLAAPVPSLPLTSPERCY